MVPVLLDGMSVLVKERPPNPVEWLGAFHLLRHNPQSAPPSEAFRRAPGCILARIIMERGGRGADGVSTRGKDRGLPLTTEVVGVRRVVVITLFLCVFSGV
ncbi:unnamed protein product [Pylaiella littoralis]